MNFIALALKENSDIDGSTCEEQLVVPNQLNHLAIVLCQEYAVAKFHAGTIFTSQIMDWQAHVIGKAIRPLFTELVTNV